MKIFKFDPDTGRRGEEIGTKARIDWTSEFLPVAFKPLGFGLRAVVTVHRDAGIGMGEDELSYRHPTDWTCFCSGEFHTGANEDGSPEYEWMWTVLPPAE